MSTHKVCSLLSPSLPSQNNPHDSGEPTVISNEIALRWTVTMSMWGLGHRGLNGKFVHGHLVFACLWGKEAQSSTVVRGSFPDQLAPSWGEQDGSQTCHSHSLPLLSLATTRGCRKEIVLAGSWGTQVVPAAASSLALVGSTYSNMHCMFNMSHLIVWEQELEAGDAVWCSLMLLGKEEKVDADPS